MATVVLIDANALVHRAYHALPPLSTKSGEQTNAVFGFASMLIKVLTEEAPEYVVVCFDKGRTFRHDVFTAYKAQRPKMAEDLAPQFSRVREIVEAFGFPIYEMEGYEADDLIGTLARQAEAENHDVLIVTGDTDTLQLVSPHVRVLVTRRGITDTMLYDEAAVRERYGLEPDQLADLRGLRGDATDNIPGVPGIGDKTATKLLIDFGSVERIYEQLDRIDPKLREKLSEYKEQALLSKRLATIITNAPVTLDLSAARVGAYNRERVLALFRELEFRSLVNRLPAPESKTVQQMALFGEGGPLALPARIPEGLPPPQIADTVETVRRVAKMVTTAGSCVVDVESTSFDTMAAELVGIAIAVDDETFYLPVGHHDTPGVPLPKVQEILGPVLADDRIRKTAHNAKYDLLVLTSHGFVVNGLDFDTMIAAYLLSEKGLGLKDLAFTKLGITMTPITDLIGKGKDQITMAKVPVDQAAPYACADVAVTARLRQLFEPELRRQGLWTLFTDIEMPLVPILADMERTGVALDVPLLQRLSRELKEKIGQLEQEIYATVGHQFNINSTQQLASVLFDELKLTKVKRTRTGYSTDSSVLEELRGAHPIIDFILEHRQLVKLKSTYVDALPLLVNPRTGRVHTSFNQTVAATGRLSSSDPNLQNIPIRTDLGRQVRRAFIARPGWLLMSADYSQIELRILAHMSKDPALTQAFLEDKDIHAATAAAVFNVPLDQVTPAMRRVAKTINFGVSYGVSGYGLAQSTGLPQEEATKIIEDYFARYPGVRTYVEETKAAARRDGYVATLTGRRRYLPELQAANRQLVAAAERMAINMPIQGTAADIIKIAMVRLSQEMRSRALRSCMILQVHDELVFEVPPEELEVMRPLVRTIMEGAMALDVALKVDVKVGKNWDEME